MLVLASFTLLVGTSAFVPAPPLPSWRAAPTAVEGSRSVASVTSQRQRRPLGSAAASTVRMGIRRNLLAAAALAPALANPLQRRAALAIALTAGVACGVAKFIDLLDTPSRPYNQETNTVGQEYDTWTTDGILESVWGEHIHLGYYTDEERRKGYLFKDIVGAKYDFIDRMMEFGKIEPDGPNRPKSMLDVGCGIGGTSRYLAAKFGDRTKVTGITLSPQQVRRGMELVKERKLDNVELKVMDALAMTLPDNSVDLVWACESGEHMPDKKRYIEEMMRVLKPGGRFVMATWCQRDNSTVPFSPDELKRLDLLYNEWTHPYFISIEDYVKLIEGTGVMEDVQTADWAAETLPSWRHTIWAGIVNPWPFLRRPRQYWRTLKDAWCIERMHQAFSPKLRLMRYGMFTAVKKMEGQTAGAAAA